MAVMVCLFQPGEGDAMAHKERFQVSDKQSWWSRVGAKQVPSI